jgi:Putative metal-binding motif/Secretion system C-terminal sorting domain
VTTNSAGCTHTQTLNLIINNNTSGTTTATACDSYTWSAPLGNGFTYTSSQTGITHTSILPGGCQHVETLNLTINRSTSGTTNAVGCGSYTWAAPLGNGQTYTTNQTGITNVTTNAAGCPHVETLNLTINQSSTLGNTTVTAQNSYTWAANGVTYTTSGVYTFTSVNSGGCPNVATLNLTIITGSTWYADADGDGYGNPATAIFAATQPTGYVAIGTDCDDTRPLVNPGAVEVCYDGLDNDCNGIIDNVGIAGGCTPITTSLLATHCGSTITNLSTTITAYYVVGAQGYRFRVRNLTTNAVQIKDRPTNTFTFSSLIGINIGTSYQVDVALLLNGVWQPFYGAPCIINTASPVSTLGAQCGTTLTSMNQWVYATYYSTASGYRFRVTNTSTSAVQTLTTSLNRFYFNQLPSQSFGTTYFVEVALRNTDGTYLPYGPGCNITTPPSARETEEAGDDAVANTSTSVKFKAIAYPNPFADHFKLNITTANNSAIQIRVYDMLGKQLESRNVEVNEIENLEVGINYPSGVYNVIVTQGNATQTIRVIKR